MKNPAVLFIVVTLVIDAMGIGLIIPVMPDLLEEVGASDLSRAALWGGILSTTFAAMQFVFGPVLGGVSDRIGRRPVLLVSLAALAVDYLVMAVAGTLWLLLLGRMFGGIMAATQATANAYMADITAPEDRAANFGLLGAAFGVGFVLGPLIGGALAEFGTRAPFYAAAVLSAANAVLGFFVLKETLPSENRRAFSWRRANPLGTFVQLRKLPGVGLLLVVFFIYQVAFVVYPSVWAFYGAKRYGWDPGMIALSLGLFGIMLAIVQGGLIRPILRYLGERGTVIYGHGVNIIAFIALASATTGSAALYIVCLAALAAVVTPALQGIMSKAVGADSQGELQGALVTVSALAMILSPMIMTSTFAAFTAPQAAVYLPGAPFLLSAGLVTLGLATFLKATSRPARV